MKVTGSTFWDNEEYYEWESAAFLGEEEVQRIEKEYNCAYPSYKELWDAVKEWLVENDYYYSGFTYQARRNTVPVIDNKWLFQVSYRTWGTMIAEAHPELIESDQKSAYAVWAWRAPGPERLPEEEEID